MTPKRTLENAAEVTGWNDRSKLMVALRYIKNQNKQEAFADFVEQEANKELGEDVIYGTF
jgi:prophage maintenance system killer protein